MGTFENIYFCKDCDDADTSKMDYCNKCKSIKIGKTKGIKMSTKSHGFCSNKMTSKYKDYKKNIYYEIEHFNRSSFGGR